MSSRGQGASEAFYDEMTGRLLRDYVEGNPRVARQLRFLRAALPRAACRVLIIGCGAGEVAAFVARKATPRAEVTALDLSGENVRAARRLFPHPRIRFVHADALRDSLGADHDAIVFPDSYEHLPRADWAALHIRLAAALAPTGRVALTLPSPDHQRYLAELGRGLQPIDESVTRADLHTLAASLGGTLVYHAPISVWRDGDYVHALIERPRAAPSALATASPFDRGAAPAGPFRMQLDALRERIARRWRRRRVQRLHAA